MTTPLTIGSLTCYAGPTWSAFLLGQSYAAGQGGGFSSLGSTTNPFVRHPAELSSAAGAAAALGIDEIYGAILTIVNGTTQTLDLTALADVAGRTVALVRLKFLYAYQLRPADDATIAVAATSLTIGGAVSNAHPLFLSDVTDKYLLRPGRTAHGWDAEAAGEAVSSGAKSVLLTNPDSDTTRTGKLVLVLGGGLV